MLGPQGGVGVPGRHHSAREQGGTPWPLFLAPPLRPAGTDAEVQETLQSQAKQANARRTYSCLRARRAPSTGRLWRLPSLGFSAWASCWWYHPAVNLSWGNTAVDNSSFPTMVRIHLRRSKCDQFGRGVDVVIARTGTSLCPVTAIVNYLYVHQDRPGAFFCLRDGTPVSMPWFIAKIRHPVFHLPSTSRLWLGLGSERQHWRVWRTLPFRPWAMAECSFSAVHPHPSGLPSHTEWQRQEFFRPLLQTKSAIYPPHAYTVLGETNYYNYPWGF